MEQDEGVGPSTFPEPRRLSRTPSLSLSSAYMRPGVCSMYCRCRCHRAVAQSLSPRTENLLIKIFAQLQGRPQLVKSCNVFNCRMSLSNRARVVVLHARLFKRILKVAALSENFRLKLSLKAHPVVKDSSDIIKFSEAGDFHRLGRLIKTGRASPSTAGPDGWTLLHVSQRVSNSCCLGQLTSAPERCILWTSGCCQVPTVVRHRYRRSRSQIPVCHHDSCAHLTLVDGY